MSIPPPPIALDPAKLRLSGPPWKIVRCIPMLPKIRHAGAEQPSLLRGRFPNTLKYCIMGVVPRIGCKRHPFVPQRHSWQENHLRRPGLRRRMCASRQEKFISSIAPGSHFHLALNQLPNTRVLVKDAAGRFVWVSDNVPRRHGFAEPAAMVGLDDLAINPPRLAKAYRRDDREVMESGRPLLGKVELAFDEGGILSWHVTNKLPLRKPPRQGHRPGDHHSGIWRTGATAGLRRRTAKGNRTYLRPPRRAVVGGGAVRPGRRLMPPVGAAIPQRGRHESHGFHCPGPAGRGLPAIARGRPVDQQDCPGCRFLRPERLHPLVSPALWHDARRVSP